jgi:hypothetical protein
MKHRDQSDGYAAQPVEIVAVKPGPVFRRRLRLVRNAGAGRAGQGDRPD